MATYDMKSLGLVSGGLTSSAIVFGAAGGQAASAPDPLTINALRDYLQNNFTALTIAQGTITAQQAMLDGTVTWNNAGVTFTAWKLNVTNTNSAAASLLADFQVGGSSKFKVDRSGLGTFAAGIVLPTGDGTLAWSTDLFLQRDAANALGL